MNQEKEIHRKEESKEERKPILRKTYRKPRLEKLGDLRTLTLGVSGAPVDFSGGAENQKTP